MSIELCIVEDQTREAHEVNVQNYRNQGFERVASFVYKTPISLYISFMERNNAPAHKNGVYMASLLEVLERQVNDHESRLEVLEETADADDELPADRIKVFDIHGTLIDLINPHTSQFIPLGNVYDQVVYEALNEDEQEGR